MCVLTGCVGLSAFLPSFVCAWASQVYGIRAHMDLSHGDPGLHHVHAEDGNCIPVSHASRTQ